MRKKIILLCTIFLITPFAVSISQESTVPVSLTDIPSPIGDGWETACSSSLWGVCLVWGVFPTEDHTISIKLSDGWIDDFSVMVNTSYANPNGLAQGYINFEGFKDTLGALDALDNVTFDFLMGNQLLDMNFNVIDPHRYRYTLNDTAYYFDLYQDIIYTLNVDGTSNILPDPAPLPPAVLLLGSGLIGLAGFGRKKFLIRSR